MKDVHDGIVIQKYNVLLNFDSKREIVCLYMEICILELQDKAESDANKQNYHHHGQKI